jgi:uncharacterized protein (DUF488 family)
MSPSAAALPVFSIGHSTHPIEEFVALLQQASVELLVDVRSIPRSRTNPQFNADVLPHSLAQCSIDYRHSAPLGGRRHRKAQAPPSPNTFWTNTAFRNYADYALTDAFREGLHELQRAAQTRRCAMMCSEAVWWRCHRRIVADYLLASGTPVVHIMGIGKLVPARMTPGAQPQAHGGILYPETTPPTTGIDQ